MIGPLRSRVPLAAALVALAVAAACSKSPPPTPSPGPGNGESITGRERLGWDQPAPDASELATFRYAIYVDGARSVIADASCATSAGTGGFPCSGRLPTMSNGAHTLELAAFIDAGGIIEGARSAPLRVTVTGITAGQTSSIADGDITTTTDGVRLRLDVDALVEPSSLAVTGDGRVLVGGHGGGVVTVGPDGVTESLPGGTGAVLAIALSPTHERDGFVYLTHAVDGDGEAPDLKVGPTGEAPTGFRTDAVFRTARYRGVRSRLAERMVVLEDGPSSAEPAAALRVGPDGKLYAAFDN
ncbi:MAG TPA: hypothetical protein VNJ03_11270 [Vicinamibacterales bacterium]|nr:hypothetical protein [Vicinamibacterales bacterium]